MVTVFEKDRRIVMTRNPNYRGEPYPCEGMPDDKAGRPAGRLRQEDTRSSTAIVSTVEREGTPLRNKFRDGYYDLEVFERTDTGTSYIVEMLDSDEVRADYEKKGFNFPKYADVNSYIIGFNMIDPVLGHGETPAAARAQPQAAPGDLDRDRLGRVLEDLPEEGRPDRDEPVARRHPGLARGDARGHQPGDVQGRRTARRCGARSTRPSS